ncbi:MAG: endonuclease/exonuclease/phosphatase family protein, partial [Nitrospirota bacterium]|nr:endonuclease/exonuclease/phosphatase family protein [Nitrospirota bacterium]
VYSVASGTDALAAKGVLHVRLWRGGDAPLGHAIDVFVTHLQANHRDIRATQIEELAQFIHTRSDPTRAALLLGDFNVDGAAIARRDPGAEYHSLIRRLGALGFRDLGQTLGGTNTGERRRIDYIFLRSNQLRPIDIRAELFTTLRRRALSDHAAVTADFRWTPQAPQRRMLARAVPGS